SLVLSRRINSLVLSCFVHEPGKNVSVFRCKEEQIFSKKEKQSMSHSTANPLLNPSAIAGTGLSVPNDAHAGTVPQLIAAQATIWPDAIAAVHGKAMLTYKELDQRADRLARFLQSAGVGPDVVVGIYLNRSLATLVAALAVMKAGGAYLP